jgi:thiol-disulfide isomerase/thioredoxin
VKRVAALAVAMLGCSGGDGHDGKGFAPLTGAREPAHRDAAVAIDGAPSAVASMRIVPVDGFDVAALEPYRPALAACLAQIPRGYARVDLLVIGKGIVMVSPEGVDDPTCLEHALPGIVVDRPGVFDLVAANPMSYPLVIVDVCATWATPCRRLAPTLAKVSGAFSPSIVRVEQVLNDADPSAIAAWRAQYQLSFAITGADDPRGASVDSVPTTMIYDGAGTLRQTLVGPVTEDSLRAALRPLLPTL